MHLSGGPTRLTRHPHLTDSHPPRSLSSLHSLTLTLTLTLTAQSRFTSSVSPTLLKPKLTVHPQATVPHRPLSPTQGPTPTSPALPCHPDPVHPSIFGLVLCAPCLHCTSTRAPKHIRRDGILCLSSAAAQDWSITLRLRTLLASSVFLCPSSATHSRPRLHHLVVRTWPRSQVTEFRDRGSCQEHNHEVTTRANKNRPKPRVVEPGKKPQRNMKKCPTMFFNFCSTSRRCQIANHVKQRST